MLEAGARVGDYEIESELGEGGMARVYRARHVMLDTHHALKVLDPELRLNAQARQRFLDEAKIQAKHLDHPGIVKVTNIIASADHAALVMELVDGKSLEDEVGKLVDRPAEIRRIMLAVLEAVGHAHAKGIVHRDLKPANVLLAGPGRTPKVSDFGIAKLTEVGAATKKSTHATARMGTLSYMSPEQVRAAKDVTARSDIFSLGALLYELATGHLPFEAENDFDVMTKIVNGSHRPPGERNPKIDPQLAEVIERALAPDPAKRFASCAEMAAALGGSTAAAAPVRTEAPPQARSRAPLWAALALGACAATGAVVYLMTRTELPAKGTVADAPVVVSSTVPSNDAAMDAAAPVVDAAIDAAEPAPIDAPPAPDPAIARRAAWLGGVKGFDITWPMYVLGVRLTNGETAPKLSFRIAEEQGTMQCGLELGADGNPTALTSCKGVFYDTTNLEFRGRRCSGQRSVSVERVEISACTNQTMKKQAIVHCKFTVRVPECSKQDTWVTGLNTFALWRAAIPEDTAPAAPAVAPVPVPAPAEDAVPARRAAWLKGMSGFDLSFAMYTLGVRISSGEPSPRLSFRVRDDKGTMQCGLELGADGHPTALTGCKGQFHDVDNVKNHGAFCSGTRPLSIANIPISRCTTTTLKKQRIIQCPFSARTPSCDFDSKTWGSETIRFALWRPAVPEDASASAPK